MRSTDAQVRKLMEEVSRTGEVGLAALRSGMDRKTARKYVKEGRLPSESDGFRTWRTRSDPFEKDWPEIAVRLADAPSLEARVLFEELLARWPDRYRPGQVRTFQRRVKRWRAESGPEKRVFLAQLHRAGEAMQTDFTWGTELGITIAGEPFGHLLCHPVLPYSNWEWATVCRSESMAALRRGVQAAVFRLGRVPEYHPTDHSTAATHELSTGKRGYNEEYLALLAHLGMKPRTTGVGEKEQNGDVEALNGALKRRLRQHLLVRGSREFESVETYERWIEGIIVKANGQRLVRLREELDAMRPLVVTRLPEYSEVAVGVSTWGTIYVRRNTYSVPSRLEGERVRARVFEDHVEVWFAGALQLSTERLRGEGGHRVDYRHVIWSLVRHPGAFERYRYRGALFPTSVFRATYDALQADRPGRSAVIEYLRILHLAASTVERNVEAACARLLEAREVPIAARVKMTIAPVELEVPALAVPVVDLTDYDGLLEDRGPTSQEGVR